MEGFVLVHGDTPSGERVRLAREDAGMTQFELGELVGVRAQEISRYENDASVPPPARVRRIARATGRPVPFFYGEGDVSATVDLGGAELLRELRDILAEREDTLVSALRRTLREELAGVISAYPPR